MPDPGSPWERENPNDGFGYLPWPIRTLEDQAKWDACNAHYEAKRELFSYNPSEYERMTQEAAEQRSEQYKKQMKSERLIRETDTTLAADVARLTAEAAVKKEQLSRLIFLRGALTGYRPKAEKEAILGEIRELEVALGLWSEPYNGETR